MWSPISVGDGRVSHHTFTTDSGIFALTGLSNNALSLHLVDTSNATLRICTGTFNITDGPNGKADFTPTVADVATAGIYRAYPVVTLATGPVAMDPQILEILNNT
jgi:hypothetical protein